MVDTATGAVVHTLRFHDVITELYDVVALEGCTNPTIVGMKGEDAMRIYAIGRMGDGPSGQGGDSGGGAG